MAKRRGGNASVKMRAAGLKAAATRMKTARIYMKLSGSNEFEAEVLLREVPAMFDHFLAAVERRRIARSGLSVVENDSDSAA